MCGRRRWILLGVYSLIVLGCIEAPEGRLRGWAELPCAYQSRSHPIEQLLVYWQREVNGKHLFVVGVKNGDLYTEKQDENYRGRAWLSPPRWRTGDFTLHLSGLKVMDNGTYDCFVFSNTVPLYILQKNTIKLHITAEYTTPVITRAEPTERSTELTLTCTTEGGTPHPEIRWINASDGTPIHEDHIHNDIKGDKEMINVTSTITINVTSSTNLSCVVMTTGGNLTSNMYVSEVEAENPESGGRHEAPPTLRDSALVVLVLAIIAGLAAIAVLKRHSLSGGCCRHAEYHRGAAESEQM